MVSSRNNPPVDSGERTARLPGGGCRDTPSDADPRATPYAAPRHLVSPDAEFPDWFKLVSGLMILVSLVAVTSQAFVSITGLLLPPYLLFLSHPVWQAVSILLVPILVIYSVFRRKQRTWKIDLRSSGWANFFLWWGVVYYLLLGIQLLVMSARYR